MFIILLKKIFLGFYFIGFQFLVHSYSLDVEISKLIENNKYYYFKKIC